MDIEQLKSDLRDVAKDSSYTYVHDICNNTISLIDELQDRLRAADDEKNKWKLAWKALLDEKHMLEKECGITSEGKASLLERLIEQRDHYRQQLEAAKGQEPVKWAWCTRDGHIYNLYDSEKSANSDMIGCDVNHCPDGDHAVPLYALPPILDEQVRYQSACSGLWYSTPGACGDIAAVKINDAIYTLQSHPEPKQAAIPDAETAFEDYVKRQYKGGDSDEWHDAAVDQVFKDGFNIGRNSAPSPVEPLVKALEKVDGDLLPPIGDKVRIHLASNDAWVEQEVTGYYVWGAHDSQSCKEYHHRVFVRVVDADGTPNARLLKDVQWPIREQESQEKGNE